MMIKKKREQTMDSHKRDADLFARYNTNRDPTIREEIILNYLPLVHFVLGRLNFSQSMGADYEDAASQGLIGLIEAIERYDPSFGTQFSTYATLRIRGRVLDHLRSLDWLSRTARKRARSVQQAITHLWGELHRAPTDDELASYLGMNQASLQKALVDANHVIISMDSEYPKDGDSETSLHDVLADENQTNPAELFEDKELKEHLILAIKDLNERQQILLSLYYYEELTLKEIGAVLSVSESRVCQLHARAVMDLKSIITQTRTKFSQKRSSTQKAILSHDPKLSYGLVGSD
jgi:RNA polymerase sigma factor for flagellar operon FliA